MALITLLRRFGGQGGRRTLAALAALGIFGAALFFGDSMITPAMSMLSAVEGLKVVEPSLAEWVVPITAVISLVLFSVQRYGTNAVGRLFGPVMIALVRLDRRLRREGHPRPPANPQGPVADLCGDVRVGARQNCVLRTRRSRARGHRRGGAVRRHGPFRSTGHHPGLATCRAAGMHSQLSRPRRAGARRRVRGERPVLFAHPALGAAAHGAIGNRRNGYRISGGDHRGLFGGIGWPLTWAICRDCE